MTQCLDLYQPNFDFTYVLRCDASYFAIGAVSLQEYEGKERSLGFYSRELAKGQLNWAPLEREMYAAVGALLQWDGLMNFQPVIVCTRHRPLEH